MSPFSPRRTIVLVMHSDPILGAGLAEVLRRSAAFDVKVCAADEKISDGGLVDVVVADYDNAMRLLAHLPPATDRLAPAKTLVVTSNDGEADIRRAVESGVLGYVLLGTPLNELLDGVTSVANGVRYLSRSVARRVTDSLCHTPLTARESDVMGLVAAGACNKAIARELGIQVSTVKSHVTAILAKFGASSRTHAAGIAASRGLVDPRMPTRRAVSTRPAAARAERVPTRPLPPMAASWVRSSDRSTH